MALFAGWRSQAQEPKAEWEQRLEDGSGGFRRSSMQEVQRGLVTFYDWFLTVRLLFAMVMATGVFLSVGLGLAFQSFLGLFLYERSPQFIFFGVFGVPLVITVVALFVAEFVDVGSAMLSPKLRKASNLYISEALGRPESTETIGKLVIGSFELGVFVGPVLCGLFGESLMDTGKMVLRVVVMACLSWTSLYALVLLVCKAYLQFDKVKHASLVSRLGLAKEELLPFAWLNEEGDAQGGRELVKQSNPGASDSDTHKDLYDPLDHVRTLSFRGAGIGLALAGVWLAALAVVLFTATMNATMIAVAFFGFFFPALALISCSLGSLVPTNGCFGAVYWFFMLLSVLLACGGIATSDSPVLDAGPVDASNVTLPFSPGAKHEYMPAATAAMFPVCSMRWGVAGLPAEKGLSAIDLGVFAAAVYEVRPQTVREVIHSSFEGTALGKGMVVESIAPHEQIGKWAVIKIPAAKLRVVAVAGTHTFLDGLADADLWATVKVMQTISRVTSMLNMLPAFVVNHLVGLFSLHKWFGEPPIWAPVEDAAAKAKRDSAAEGFDTVITGHSLGGGLSQIIGAHLDLPVLGWSPVGVGYSLDRFGVDRAKVFETSVIIKPDFDLVPKVDLQLGVTQHIRCSLPSRDPVACHGIYQSLCEIYCMCGDVRGRDMDMFCNKVNGRSDWCEHHTHETVHQAAGELI